MSMLLSVVIEVGQVANSTPSPWIWIIGAIVIILGFIILVSDEGCFGGLMIVGGIITIIVFFLTSTGSHLGSPISQIEKNYNIEVLNKESLVLEIESADEFSSVDLSYKVNGVLYQESVMILKEEERNIADDLERYSFEIYSTSDSDKVQAVPFKACDVELCPDGVRMFK